MDHNTHAARPLSVAPPAPRPACTSHAARNPASPNAPATPRASARRGPNLRPLPCGYATEGHLHCSPALGTQETTPCTQPSRSTISTRVVPRLPSVHLKQIRQCSCIRILPSRLPGRDTSPSPLTASIWSSLREAVREDEKGPNL